MGIAPLSVDGLGYGTYFRYMLVLYNTVAFGLRVVDAFVRARYRNGTATCVYRLTVGGVVF